MADNARGIHVSPGIYSKETELTYAVKSLGITTLGLVGETQRGPAFQPMLVENWREFQSLFGGTSPEKFLGSQYPKYELPYIAKSYLTESNQLQVCRVLGLSGYNAGPAWVITTTGIKGDVHYKGESITGREMVVAVLRSRGFYEEYHKFDSTTGSCECPQQVYDALNYRVGEKGGSRNCKNAKSYNLDALALADFIPLTDSGDECTSWTYSGGASTGFDINSYNLGRFKIVGVEGVTTSKAADEAKKPVAERANGYFEYPVSLNPNDKEYILKVLGTDPINGDAPIYVEALYDVALKQMVEAENVTGLSKTFNAYQVYHKADYCFLNPVNDVISKQEESLSRRDVGKRFLADKHAVDSHVHCHMYDYQTKKIVMFKSESDSGKPYYKEGIPFMQDVELGQCYTVKQYTDVSGKRHYYYAFYDPSTLLNKEEKKKFDEECAGGVQSDMNQLKLERQDKIIDQGAVAAASTESETKAQTSDESSLNRFATLVRNNGDGKYYRIATIDELKNVYPVTCDMNDYRDAYRFASTPWIVSNIKGDFNKIELNKLFRFHTISDGSTSNNEVKISIQNVRPDEKVFDVVVRDINDTDDSQVVLERFGRCTMTPNTRDYIAYKIGSFDGVYESKSKYITVEVNETDAAINSVPAGYLGYPLSKFDGLQVRGNAKENIVEPLMKYNLNYDEDIKHRKQYFGLSSWSGVDIDAFTYKGNAAYSQEPEFLSQGFHLDSRLNMESYGAAKPLVTVDGVAGYHFDAVSASNRTHVLDGTPIIDNELNMMGSIYEYVDLRKFTVYFYGGFDGWDVYRDQRSNTDNFRRAKYLGDFNELSGEGLAFNAIDNPELLKLNQPAITSDWYAYLSAIRQFSNPEEVDINVFATPGIDLINNKMLAQEVIEMIEEERADSIYVATMPDKPMGASDFIDEMYTPDDVVYELDDTEIDSNYTCTYYPWIKYEDVDNSQYIYLPPTKDVVRNMAMTDNTTHPWFAPAGISRGDVNCVRAHYVTKLSDEDVLYEGRINPIKTFASDGVKVWGQKNLQKRESQLNRIAVRRLLLRMRKLVAISCIGLIFEPNDATTKDKFLSTVTPILDNIRANRGISDYKIEVNDTIESRERRELPAKIFFKPYNALEYIDLNFILTPEGVSFDNI